ncbi:nucleoside-diphosphate-sugar epimerase [Paraburkholderia caledonica]|uniref:Nucleoside-diphosphate-sugar epimerase n=1 Tax=Paraburkholderia caledonica TaxID=134536 RepID=A0AB73IM34_9BURK|nr:nucleoside-diphosphate-sugar epimerase [Paraburkholderia caledonica]
MTKGIFIIGATGFVGRALARHFLDAGHAVLGLARSDHAHANLSAAGVHPVRGDLDTDIASVLAAARSVDAIIYAAQIAVEREPDIVRVLTRHLAQSGKTFIFLSGTGVFMQRTGGAWSSSSFAEDDLFAPEPLATPRVEAEGIVRAAASDGWRSIVIRPPVIWGPGDNGPVASVSRCVAQTGATCYIGSGLAAYSNVHSEDLARLSSPASPKSHQSSIDHERLSSPSRPTFTTSMQDCPRTRPVGSSTCGCMTRETRSRVSSRSFDSNGR